MQIPFEVDTPEKAGNSTAKSETQNPQNPQSPQEPASKIGRAHV